MAARLVPVGLIRGAGRSLSRDVPYTPAQMFDLVADVERYPEFVPGYRSVRALERKVNAVQVEQVVVLVGIELHFRSWAELDRPHFIRVRSSDGPFEDLRVDWHFSPLAGGACRLAVQTTYALEPRLTARMVRPVVDEMIASGLGAFVRRAHYLYGSSLL